MLLDASKVPVVKPLIDTVPAVILLEANAPVLIPELATKDPVVTVLNAPVLEIKAPVDTFVADTLVEVSVPVLTLDVARSVLVVIADTDTLEPNNVETDMFVVFTFVVAILDALTFAPEILVEVKPMMDALEEAIPDVVIFVKVTSDAFIVPVVIPVETRKVPAISRVVPGAVVLIPTFPPVVKTEPMVFADPIAAN
jgi:hypothetical protein